jgi:hypothetical protein
VGVDGVSGERWDHSYLTTGSTGQFKGINGMGRYSGLGESDSEGKPTRNEYSAEGEYWFEK